MQFYEKMTVQDVLLFLIWCLWCHFVWLLYHTISFCACCCIDISAIDFLLLFTYLCNKQRLFFFNFKYKRCIPYIMTSKVKKKCIFLFFINLKKVKLFYPWKKNFDNSTIALQYRLINLTANVSTHTFKTIQVSLGMVQVTYVVSIDVGYVLCCDYLLLDYVVEWRAYQV